MGAEFAYRRKLLPNREPTQQNSTSTSSISYRYGQYKKEIDLTRSQNY